MQDVPEPGTDVAGPDTRPDPGPGSGPVRSALATPDPCGAGHEDRLGLRSYRPPAGAARDELIGPDGALQPLWAPLIEHLSVLGPEGLAAAVARAEIYLRDSGVFFRQYDAGQSIERPWPLAPLPVLIDQDDWAGVSAALIQRADLLEAVMADLYGPNRLVAGGHLPPALLASSPEWLRPLVGVRPRSGHYLHFLAFEIGRGPDGNWWVLADRVQAPSGAGYALENRVATARAFPGAFGGQNVHRLAGFFGQFRDALLAQRQGGEGPVAILTPGPLNETYYEQAWIARYLGFTLVQGDDLTVQGGRLMVRTVSGLRPVDVLWRRLDGSYADPLELDPASRLGTPGLVAALRQGSVTMVNALGSGVLETRALMAFLPKLAPLLLGEGLKMPNIATWWLGGAPERSAVLADPSRMVLSDALGTGLPFDSQGQAVAAGSLTPQELSARLTAGGGGLVAQEAVILSTTPALVDGRLAPRPLSLRVFVGRTAQGWTVMPGGFARIGAAPDPGALAMQRGGHAADVWIVSPAPVPAVTILPPVTGPFRRAAPGMLPSRAADNLFWLGRYAERSGGLVRLLRARNMRLIEGGPGAQALLDALDAILTALGADPARGIPQGLLDTLGRAVDAAGQVRDRFSPDGWSALNDLDRTARRMALRVTPGDDAIRALSALLRKLAGFSGLVQDNMYRFQGWRFLSLGRQIERGAAMAGVLAALTGPDAPEGALDTCIELGDSVLTHRRRFMVETTRSTVIDLLVLDGLNPRAIRHQLDAICDQLDHLPALADPDAAVALRRAARGCRDDLARAEPDDLTPDALLALRGGLWHLSDLLTGAYLR